MLQLPLLQVTEEPCLSLAWVAVFYVHPSLLRLLPTTCFEVFLFVSGRSKRDIDRNQLTLFLNSPKQNVTHPPSKQQLTGFLKMCGQLRSLLVGRAPPQTPRFTSSNLSQLLAGHRRPAFLTQPAPAVFLPGLAPLFISLHEGIAPREP